MPDLPEGLEGSDAALTRLQEYLTAAAAERLQRDDPVCRPIGEGRWELGYEYSPVIVVYPHRPGPLEAAYSAFRKPGRASDLVAFNDGATDCSCVSAANAMRNALRQRVAPWIEERTGCNALADAIRMVQISADR